MASTSTCPPGDCQTLVVIGNGMVGQYFLETLMALDRDRRFRIVVIAEENRCAYDRVRLSQYFAGSSADDLALTTPEFFERHGIELKIATKVDDINRTGKQLTLSDGTHLRYDKLVLATGSYPFVPPIDGIDRDECFVYRTIEDLDSIIAGASDGARSGVVIGGGLLGLEAANALKHLGLDTHVVEFAPTLMNLQLDRAGGKMLQRKIEALDVSVHACRNTARIEDGTDHRLNLVFADGQTLETDLVVVSAGIRPRDELTRCLGLPAGPRGGFEVDGNCRTGDVHIYAIGECASWSGRVFGLVAPGYEMAKVVAENLCGQSARFDGADMSTRLKLLGVDVASVGDALARTPGAQCYSMTHSMTNGPGEIYRRLVVSEDGKRLLGAVLVGDTEQYDYLLRLSRAGDELPEQPEALLLPLSDESGAGIAGLLAAEAQVCSCHNVTKAELCAAVENGASCLADLKAMTKASTGCGGCTQLATRILNAELESRGVSVDKNLCPHFAFTRQELYHLVRVENIRNFAELIAKHGTGMGCDICKPAAASIFASCWNEYVLSSDKAPLQDTNDHFLANMQKNGTYSVVPRVPGGEITPDKLIVLGQVAKKYDLYTKITGGQRVDLFGATVDQLPEIWEELIDAGFETGHAYGKAVRTVKSCVGSTWCRYGVLDSVGMAIRIENRYKGLRAPHKLKFAVSGCTRECAEAQSKDVGVIATENGWNLYVCGNGGMRPRHADLFATGIDDDALIRYIDRFLMFYVRTADRLQRTSVWMESLEGGLAYLQDVVLRDSIGLAAQLEDEMNSVVGSYECEWARAINDPESRRRFRSFVNTATQDKTLHFVRERGQRRPSSDGERTGKVRPLRERTS
jgi:nitrite reductase (NADH) large subunit